MNNYYSHITPLTDATIMEFGKYKNHALDDIPDDYLSWFWNQYRDEYLSGKMNWEFGISLMMYIKSNEDSIDLTQSDFKNK